jgi:hypothetical protein
MSSPAAVRHCGTTELVGSTRGTRSEKRRSCCASIVVLLQRLELSLIYLSIDDLPCDSLPSLGWAFFAGGHLLRLAGEPCVVDFWACTLRVVCDLFFWLHALEARALACRASIMWHRAGLRFPRDECGDRGHPRARAAALVAELFDTGGTTSLRMQTSHPGEAVRWRCQRSAPLPPPPRPTRSPPWICRLLPGARCSPPLIYRPTEMPRWPRPIASLPAVVAQSSAVWSRTRSFAPMRPRTGRPAKAAVEPGCIHRRAAGHVARTSILEGRLRRENPAGWEAHGSRCAGSRRRPSRWSGARPHLDGLGRRCVPRGA